MSHDDIDSKIQKKLRLAEKEYETIAKLEIVLEKLDNITEKLKEMENK